MLRSPTRLTPSRARYVSKKAPSGRATIDLHRTAARRSMISDYDVTRVSTLYASGKVKCGTTMTPVEITNAFNMMSAQLQQVQTALAAEPLTTADFRHSMYRGGDSGTTGATRRGQMKEVPLNVYTNKQVSGKLQVVGQRHGGFWNDRIISSSTSTAPRIRSCRTKRSRSAAPTRRRPGG